MVGLTFLVLMFTVWGFVYPSTILISLLVRELWDKRIESHPRTRCVVVSLYLIIIFFAQLYPVVVSTEKTITSFVCIAVCIAVYIKSVFTGAGE